MKKTLLTGILLSLTSLSFVSAMDTMPNDAMMKKDTMGTVTQVNAMADTMPEKMSNKTTMTSGDTSVYTTIMPSSKKEDISKLQMMLVNKGYLSMPYGVSYGYYGMRTKAAFKKYMSMSMMKSGTSTTTMMKAADIMMMNH
jgi:hypothetical protein